MRRTKNVFIQTRSVEADPLVVPLEHLKHLIARPVLLHTLYCGPDHSRIEEERIDAVIRYLDGVHEVVLVRDGDVPPSVLLMREEVKPRALCRPPRRVLLPQRSRRLSSPLKTRKRSLLPARVVLRFELELLNDESVDVAEGGLNAGSEEGHDGRRVVREDPGGGAVLVAVVRGVAKVHVALVVAEDGADRSFDGRVLLETGRLERGVIAVVEAFFADGTARRTEDGVAPVRERALFLRPERRVLVVIDCEERSESAKEKEKREEVNAHCPAFANPSNLILSSADTATLALSCPLYTIVISGKKCEKRSINASTPFARL